MTTQVQSNLGYVHLKRSLATNERFRTLLTEVCNNERKILHTKLQMIQMDSRVALLDSYGPGHAITRAGAAAYITVCKPKIAKLRTAKNCTQEIPVLVGNETLYADALTLIIQRYATVLPCDSITPI